MGDNRVVSLQSDTRDLAGHYESNSDYQFQGGKLLVKQMGITSGLSVFDLGCGTGLLTAHVAELVGPDGRVFGLDPLQDRIDIARDKAKPNLIFEVGDAQDLSPFGSGTADAAFMNSVIHWIPNQLKAVQEAHRLLKPGGRIGIATGTADYPQPHLGIKARVLSLPRYEDLMSYEEGVLDPSQRDLEALLRTAGSHSIETVVHPSFIEADSTKGMVDLIESSSFGNYLGHLPTASQGPLRDDIESEFESLRTTEGKIRMD